jgi:hypothetical protein
MRSSGRVRFAVIVMLLLTLLCIPVVIMQRNWAGLAVVILALTVSAREVMTAIQRGRNGSKASGTNITRGSRQ